MSAPGHDGLDVPILSFVIQNIIKCFFKIRLQNDQFKRLAAVQYTH